MDTQQIDTEQTKIAIINNNIQYIQKDISDIKNSVDKLAGVYVTRLQFDAAFKTRDEKIDALTRSSNFWKWLTPTISALLVGILEFLLISYIQHLR